MAAGAAHADELCGSPLVIRAEHDADRARHDVEARVGERQRLGVGLDPIDRHARRGSVLGAALEQDRGDVDAGHVRAGLCGGDGDVARAAGDVQHLLAAVDLQLFDESRAEAPDQAVGHLGVVAGRPDLARSPLGRVSSVSVLIGGSSPRLRTGVVPGLFEDGRRGAPAPHRQDRRIRKRRLP